MKTQKSNSLKTITTPIAIGITFLVTLLILVSWKSKEGSKGSATSTSQAEVKAPQIGIHTAVLTDNLDALQQHIAAGSNLDEKDPYVGSSPLIIASLFDKTEMARTLIEAGADINFKNNDGSTPLHTASFFCRPEIVKLLLDKGADKTIRNNFGGTAYEAVAGAFGDVKNTYNILGKMLGPLGLKLDYPYIEKTRPEIAAMLK